MVCLQGGNKSVIEIAFFINTHRTFTSLMLAINTILNYMLIKKIYLKTSKDISEAKGRRLIESSIYQKCTKAVTKYIDNYERRRRKTATI